MEPISAITALIGLADVAFRTASALVEYTKNIQNASADRKLLAEETCCLSMLLGRFRDRDQSPGFDEKWLDTRKDLVKQFERAYYDLATLINLDALTGELKQESRLKTIRTLSKWSFSKNEVYSLLERVTRLQQYASTLLLDEQFSLVERVDRRQQEAIDIKQKQAVFSWLSPLQMSNVHQTISSRVGEGSGRWFVTSEKFLDWQWHKQKLLWCSGIPGAGKTIMASIVVDHLRRQREQKIPQSNVGVAVIYLKYNEPEQTLENTLASLLKQLAQEQKEVPKRLDELYERYRDQNGPPSLDEISSTLLSVIEIYTEVYFVIDALDECSDELRWGLLEKLRACPPQVHLMITSRFLDSINEELEDFARLEIKANRADLELFIDHHIQKNKNLQRVVEKSPNMRIDIKEGVVKTAEDMFLLARLHVESLASAAALSIKHVRKKLQTLPTTLVGTYDDAMRRIEAQEPDHSEIALKTLAWVSYAFRSLSLRELQHALIIEPGHSELDEELLLDGQSITALCAGLVVVEPETNVVNLVHYTTKKYFESNRLVRFPGFHATITMSCATYLALKELKNTSIWNIAQNFPLACYAAQYMGDHARQNPEEALEPSILQVICHLLSHPDKRKPLLSLLDGLDLIKSGFYSSDKRELLSADIDIHSVRDLNIVRKISSEERLRSFSASRADENTNATLKDFQHDNYPANRDFPVVWEGGSGASQMAEVTALHLAASMGLAKVASMLLKEVSDINAVDTTGKTAPAVAMERGFEKAVEFLVNSGASVDLGTEHGQGVFLLITESDWSKVAEIIALKANSEVSSNDTGHRQDPVRLLLAAYYGDETEPQRLVKQKKIDVKFGDRQTAATALFLAVERSHPQVVQNLLDSGVDVNSRDTRGRTSLHRATRRENSVLMKILLRNGAQVDCKNDEGRTAWSANLRSRSSVLCILLEAGANPSTRGHQGVSELYDAATNGETDVVKYMLESGTNPSIKTQFRWAPLHWAAYYGHINCVKLLIEAGADLSPVSDQDATPLDLSIRANQIAIADLLTRAGALESRDVVVLTPSAPMEDELPVDGWSTSLPNPEDDGVMQIKLSLAFDKPIQQGLNVGQFIYPSTIKAPHDYIYQISRGLETLTSSLAIRQAQRCADMVEYPLQSDSFDSDNVLYEITRVALDYQTLEIHPNSQSSLAGNIKMHKDWTGGWKIHHNHQGARDYLFRTTPDWSKKDEEGCRWMTEDGTLLARSGIEGVTPVFTFEHGSERRMHDILVTCWVAKLWSETVALQRHDAEIPKLKPVDE